MLPRDKYQEAYLKKRNMDGLSEYTINSYRKTFNSLNKFLQSNNISINYSEDNLLKYCKTTLYLILEQVTMSTKKG